MVNQSLSQLDRTFAALAHPTRRAIVQRLAEGESSVSQLAAPFHMSLPAVSKHLKVLERASLIRREREGRIHRIALNPDPLRDAAHWIEHHRRFWESQLGSLANYFEHHLPQDTE